MILEQTMTLLDNLVLFQILPRFGLKDDSDDRWVKFKKKVERLNESAPAGTQYKVVYLGRHGQGYRTFSDQIVDIFLGSNRVHGIRQCGDRQVPHRGMSHLAI
ncbi:hypothetical protein JVU11DRAFT_2005 [Chiua virens]|nr:hypothetical protein JVU11DRAFT_2005 [Chiua virens]